MGGESKNYILQRNAYDHLWTDRVGVTPARLLNETEDALRRFGPITAKRTFTWVGPTDVSGAPKLPADWPLLLVLDLKLATPEQTAEFAGRWINSRWKMSTSRGARLERGTYRPLSQTVWRPWSVGWRVVRLDGMSAGASPVFLPGVSMLLCLAQHADALYNGFLRDGRYELAIPGLETVDDDDDESEGRQRNRVGSYIHMPYFAGNPQTGQVDLAHALRTLRAHRRLFPVFTL